REEVPMPPLKPLQIMPVPPPTEPSSTAPECPLSSARSACSGLTCNPLISLSQPSQVSATTGSDHQAPVASAAPCATRQAMTASRTTPTLWVLVIITGPSRKPDSSTHVVPVISPLPFWEYQPAKEKRCMEANPRGSTAVTPVRTGPLPTTSLPLPEIRVVWPTSTPSMSVIAFSGPGAPSKGT